MNINKKSRTELKTFFTRNAVPNQGNFEDLIDAPINQKDDGLTKQSGEPLSIEAGTNKEAVRLYGSFSDPNPTWTVGLQDGTVAGLTLKDGTGARRLFIDAKTGTTSVLGLVTSGPTLAAGGLEVPAGQQLRVGGETTLFGLLTAAGGINVPVGQRLSVGGEAVVAGLLTASAGLNVSAGQAVNLGGPLTAAGLVTARAGLNVSGAALNVGASGAPVALNAFGGITANNGISVNGGTLNLGNASNPVSLVGFGPVFANLGLTVPANQTLTSSGTLAANVIAASGLVQAGGGLTVPSGQYLRSEGSLLANTIVASGMVQLNAGLIVGAGQTLTSAGTLTANVINASGPVQASGGLTVPSGQTLTSAGTLTANVINASGPVTASGGLTVPSGQTLTSAGTLTANVINAGNITADVVNASGPVSASGPVNASGPVTASAGLAVSGAPLRLGADIVSQATNAGRNRIGVRLFSSASQYVTLPQIGTLPFNTGFLIQTWVYVYSPAQNVTLFDLGNGPSADNISLSVAADGSLVLQVSVSSGSIRSSITTAGVALVTTGGWMHIAVGLDIDGQVATGTIYTNGWPARSGPLAIPAAVFRSSNFIGRSSAPGSTYLNGIISDFSIFVGSLRRPNMDTLVGNEPGLVGYWRFSESSGTVVTDSCTQSNRIGNVTLQNGPTLAASGFYWDQSAQQMYIDRLTIGSVSWGDSSTRTESRDDAGASGLGIRSGFYQTPKPANFPTNTTNVNDWWHLIDCRHSSPTNNYAMQIAGYFRDQSLWFRKTNNNANGGWSLISATPGSDASLKRDVVQIEGALGKLATVRGVSFNWIDESMGKDREIGVIAQEVEKVFPELVQIHGEHRYVRYELLTPVLIEAVKTLASEVEALKRTLASMQGATALQPPAQG